MTNQEIFKLACERKHHIMTTPMLRRIWDYEFKFEQDCGTTKCRTFGGYIVSKQIELINELKKD